MSSSEIEKLNTELTIGYTATDFPPLRCSKPARESGVSAKRRRSRSVKKYKANVVLHALLIVALVLPSASFAQGSFFWMRCAAWSDPVFGSGDKQLYISGLRDGLIFSEMNIQDVAVPSMSIQETLRAVEDLCSDVANMNVPVPFILKVSAMRINGLDEDSVQLELQRLRRQFSDEND